MQTSPRRFAQSPLHVDRRVHSPTDQASQDLATRIISQPMQMKECTVDGGE